MRDHIRVLRALADGYAVASANSEDADAREVLTGMSEAHLCAADRLEHEEAAAAAKVKGPTDVR